MLERMEDRTLLSTFLVTTTSDNGGVNPDPGAGTGTLRQAIIDANADAAKTSLDTIDFAIPGTGVQTIRPLSQLPAITHPVVIDGYSQPGSSPNTLAVGDNTVLQIELDGSQAGSSAIGLQISSGQSTVRGLNIHSFASNGIMLDTAGGDAVQGCFIGTDPTGEIASTDGVVVASGDGDLIGTDGDGVNDFAERNVISSSDLSPGATNGSIVLGGGSSNDVVAGDYIGTDAMGARALGGMIGVWVNNSSFNRIGVDGHHPDPSAERNVISGNPGGGIAIEGYGPNPGTRNVVAGDYIGTDATGEHVLGNDSFPYQAAIDVTGSDGNLIGTDGDGVGDAAERNVISGNAGTGVLIDASNNVVAGNDIGTDATGTLPLSNISAGVTLAYGGTGNRIGTDGNSVDDVAESNIISANGGAGIDISGTGGGHLIAGNWIGIGSDGRFLGNGGWYGNGPFGAAGITVTSDSSDQIGGSPALTNIIANTLGVGVSLSPDDSGITIRCNSIYANGNGTAIFLSGGGNLLQQSSPVLNAVVGGASTRALGTLNSTPNATFTLDFYTNPGPDPSGRGQGQIRLGSATVTTDGNGHASFDVSNLAASSAGQWISATATAPDGSTSEFSMDVQALKAASISGVDFADFNQDGQVDFGEQGIPGVTINLDGTDSFGDPVHLSQATDGAGTYVFLGLPPGSYTITEPQQPAGYTPGINSVGTVGGTVSGNQFSVGLSAGVDAMNYNFGEIPSATGAITKGQTAGIGFWNNKNGQALIKSLNGGSTSTQLGNWLATTFPNMFGANAGSSDLAGESNAYVAAFFQADFVVHGTKLDAEVLATALAVYVTDGTLDYPNVGSQYGFVVGGNGVATATFNVGTNGAAFGVADGTVMTVMDILLAADDQAVNGVLYGGDATKRTKANNVFSAINQAGGIG
jgi:hypothetical protein